jgi:hypothetical protein
MSDNDATALLALLGQVNDLLEATPEGAELFRKLRNGEITADQAVPLLAKAAKDSGLLPDLAAASQQVHSMIPTKGDLSPKALNEANRPVVMKTSTGIPQLNPVYEAAIAERVSLDGDAPELRSGPIPEEGRPAVPVKTVARDPVVIGLMLERASNEVRMELRKAITAHEDLCQRLLEDARENAETEGLDVTTALTIAKKHLPPVPVGVPGYEAGSLPALREVVPPDPHVTAVMSPELRRVATFNVLATTQGRLSAAAPIEQGIRQALAGDGFVVNNLEPEEVEDHSNELGWTVQVYGSDDLSDAFNPIQAAIENLTAQARDLLGGFSFAATGKSPEGGWALRVIPYNNGAPQRRFGWILRVGLPAEEAS